MRDAFFYRHLGPHGPKEVPPLHPEPFSKRAAIVKPAAHFACAAQIRKANLLQVRKDLHVYSAPAREGS